MDVSVVMACLNEAETVGTCVEKAFEALRRLGLKGEVLVVDNGSTDGSGAIAASKGARVILEPKQGYGYAYRSGFREAKGRWMAMGDADGTYDFSSLGDLIAPLHNGADLVIGSRFAGEMLPGSMSWIKRHLGNRISTGMVNFFFRMKLTDSQSGFRAFRRPVLAGIDFRSTGMEFATELIIEPSRRGLRISEVPITYHPRGGNRSKFKTFRDSFSVLCLIFSSYFHVNGKAT